MNSRISVGYVEASWLDAQQFPTWGERIIVCFARWTI